MKRSALLLVSLSVFVVAASAQVKYETYRNKRFAFSIDYPSSLLKMQPPPANDDGRTFVSSDGAVELRAWGEYSSSSQTLAERFTSDLDQYGGGVSYRRLLTTGFVISGIRDDKIYYQKTLYRKSKTADVFYTFTLEYPASRRSFFDPVVRRLVASFRFDPRANV